MVIQSFIQLYVKKAIQPQIKKSTKDFLVGVLGLCATLAGCSWPQMGMDGLGSSRMASSEILATDINKIRSMAF